MNIGLIRESAARMRLDFPDDGSLGFGPTFRAIADWLAFEADTSEIAGANRQTQHAATVARAYLGSES